MAKETLLKLLEESIDEIYKGDIPEDLTFDTFIKDLNNFLENEEK
ncbi:Uncharacterised protein [Streptococcus gallolyticus]|uniref:Uncharacterized protein n=1 Tax=Streptococcus gallolyticus TaxID=315405 RepID=A0AA94M1F3_9STRE|nr:hypothetical protein [Streptococcus gallolyticus]SQG78773.1 Uncharacterised protein [Streptococcus gallolyticus]